MTNQSRNETARSERLQALIDWIDPKVDVGMYVLGTFIGAGVVGHVDAGTLSGSASWVEPLFAVLGLLMWLSGVAGLYAVGRGDSDV